MSRRVSLKPAMAASGTGESWRPVWLPPAILLALDMLALNTRSLTADLGHHSVNDRLPPFSAVPVLNAGTQPKQTTAVARPRNQINQTLTQHSSNTPKGLVRSVSALKPKQKHPPPPKTTSTSHFWGSTKPRPQIAPGLPALRSAAKGGSLWFMRTCIEGAQKETST